MSDFDAKQTLDLMLDLGRQRASKNNFVVDEGGQPEDYFVDHGGIAIHDPWTSSCGRFPVDPFVNYSESFVEWLMRPFYDDEANIIRRINEDRPGQRTDHG
jgi:hypothetical protein